MGGGRLDLPSSILFSSRLEPHTRTWVMARIRARSGQREPLDHDVPFCSPAITVVGDLCYENTIAPVVGTVFGLHMWISTASELVLIISTIKYSPIEAMAGLFSS